MEEQGDRHTAPVEAGAIAQTPRGSSADKLNPGTLAEVGTDWRRGAAGARVPKRSPAILFWIGSIGSLSIHPANLVRFLPSKPARDPLHRLLRVLLLIARRSDSEAAFATLLLSSGNTSHRPG